jgi:hypothetical protein
MVLSGGLRGVLAISLTSDIYEGAVESSQGRVGGMNNEQ